MPMTLNYFHTVFNCPALPKLHSKLWYKRYLKTMRETSCEIQNFHVLLILEFILGSIPLQICRMPLSMMLILTNIKAKSMARTQRKLFRRLLCLNTNFCVPTVYKKLFSDHHHIANFFYYLSLLIWSQFET